MCQVLLVIHFERVLEIDRQDLELHYFLENLTMPKIVKIGSPILTIFGIVRFSKKIVVQKLSIYFFNNVSLSLR